MPPRAASSTPRPAVTPSRMRRTRSMPRLRTSRTMAQMVVRPAESQMRGTMLKWSARTKGMSVSSLLGGLDDDDAVPSGVVGDGGHPRAGKRLAGERLHGSALVVADLQEQRRARAQMRRGHRE